MQSRNALIARTLAFAIAVGVGGTQTEARADELQDLKAQIEALQKKFGELEAKQETAEKKRVADAPTNVVTGGATKGSFKLPGSNTSVTLGGYVKLDAVLSNPSAGVDNKGDLFLDPNAIPVGPTAANNEHNQVKFGARESRLFVKTNTPTSMGDLNTHVEFDFYGAEGNESVSNSHGFRLRHAYAAVGQIFDRQAQVRWAQPFGSAGSTMSGLWSVRKLPLPVDSDNWTFLAGFCLEGGSNEEVPIHGVADRRDS